MVDRFSKLYRFLAMRSTTAEKLAKAFCNEWVFVYGPPKTLLTDNGPQLTAKLFLETRRVLGVRNVFTSSYYPQTNGQTDASQQDSRVNAQTLRRGRPKRTGMN